MAKLPKAPNRQRLADTKPEYIPILAGSEWCRVYFRGGEYPTEWFRYRFFGPTGSRFDHHIPEKDESGADQSRGIAYLARDVATALAEMFQTSRTVDRNRYQPWLAVMRLETPIQALDLTGNFPLAVGASMKLSSGPKSSCRNWASGFYETYPGYQALLYRSSMNGAKCLAINERCALDADEPMLPMTLQFNRSLADPSIEGFLDQAASRIGYELV